MLKTAAIFGNGMILQQRSIVAVFGETDCDFVEAKWENSDSTYEADIHDGKWLIKLHTEEATPIPSKEQIDSKNQIDSEENGGSAFEEKDESEVRTYTLVITGKKNGKETDRVTFSDIIFGEVWFAGGQSNMELELKDSFKGEEVANSNDYDYIRFYNVPKCPVIDEELYRCEAESSWQKAKGEPSRYMSAVGFYFARKLQKSLGVPVGIIDCYWGGTSATCWMTKEKTEDIAQVKEYIEEWDEVCRSKSDEVFDKEMADYQASADDWVARLEELRKKDPNADWDVINEVVGPYPWPLPRGRKSPFRPFGLHETMVKRVAPYTVKGFIYYQGEEDCVRASFYSKLNAKVIEQWREDFALPDSVVEASEKPFYLTQLPAYKGGEENSDSCWIDIREQQAICAATTPETGIAVIIDSGEQENIHPLDKKTPGYRLAEQALLNTYKSEDGVKNCVLKEAKFEGDECELIFEGTYGALCYRETDGKKLTADGENVLLVRAIDSNNRIKDGTVLGFEISSDGENYYAPEIFLKKDREDRLILKAGGKLAGKDISDVRYGWINYGVVNMYNKAGVPLMPFRKKKV